MTYQTIIVDGWKDVDVREVIRALSPNSMIVLAEPSDDCMQQWDEPVSERRN